MDQKKIDKEKNGIVEGSTSIPGEVSAQDPAPEQNLPTEVVVPKSVQETPFPPTSLVEELEVGFNPNEIKFLVYGESGVGKTVFSATWPRPLFLDIDRGLASVRHKISRIQISNWEDLQNAYAFLSSTENTFQTVVIDSLNELQKIAMAHVVGSFTGVRRSYDSLPSQSDYGKMLDDFDKFVRAIRSLPMHVVLISNVAGKEFETDIVQPQLTGKSTSRNICRMMDIVGYLFKADSSEPAKPRVMVFDEVNFVTKDRSGVLPPTITDPTFDHLYEVWAKSVHKE